MLRALRQLESEGKPIRVALVGAGAMGVGIAWQIGRTPGMRLVAIADIDPTAAHRAAQAYRPPAHRSQPSAPGDPLVIDDALSLLAQEAVGFDVLVEATNTIGFAAEVCLAAIKRGVHVVLMNAEVDLAFGPLLLSEAQRHGVVVTSDAGDQHGVLMRMIEEIESWAFRIVMAGNIKGYLDRHATAQGLLEEARIRNLNPVQCCAYTDGTKLNIEMALVANGTGLLPSARGMIGPAARRVEEVLELFDFDQYPQTGVVDYILGAEPGGGVFVVGHCDDPLQQQYLKYYKLGAGPYYLFYRPYHLCHLETTRAIALAALYSRPVLQPTHAFTADVYAFAKREILPGEVAAHGIGGDHAYGLVDRCTVADQENMLPIALLEAHLGKVPRFRRAIPRDQPIRFEDVELPASPLFELYTKTWQSTRSNR